MLLAGSGAAGTATPPFASSPTTTEAPAAEEAPAAAAIAEEGTRAYDRDLATRRAFEIIAERDREHRLAEAAKAAAAAAAAKEAAAATPLFEWEPPEIAGPPPAPPAESSAPPLPATQLRLGEPLGTAGPPDGNGRVMGQLISALIGLAIVFGLAYLADQGAAGIKQRSDRALRAVGAWRRRNAALLIVAGLAIVAASFTVLKADNLPYDYRDYVREGWLAFAGVATALIGFYDKMRAQPPPEI